MKVILKYRTYFSLILAGSIILLIAVLRVNNPYSERRDALEADRFWITKAKGSPESTYNLVAIGDSRTYRSISPDIMSLYLPELRIYNFGFSSGGLNKEIFEESEKLLNHSKSNMILIGVTPEALSDQTEKNTQYHEVKNPANSVFEKCILNPELYPFLPFERKQKQVYKNIYYLSGWVASEKIPEDTNEALSSYREEFKAHKTLSIRLKNELLEQVKSWKRNGIEIYAFRPPTTLSMLQLEDSLSGLDYTVFINEFEAAGGNWINVNRSSYHSYDGSHIDKNSAINLSAYIAKAIRRQEINF